MILFLAWAIAVVVVVPMLVLAAECIGGALASHARATQHDAPPFVVVMPAHDEAGGISAAVRAVMLHLRPRDRLVVVADNCTDDTGTIAEREGATVLTRIDPTRRGKGYALEYARDHIVDGAAQVVVIVDADCRPEPHALVLLAATAARRHAVVQGCYRLEPPADASARVRVSCFAFLVKNLIRQLGLQRLGGAAILQGSGMAFPTSIFRRVRWSTDSLVEDLELGLRLLAEGETVIFEPSAVFLSDASSDRATLGQRRRWEHGLLATATRFVPQMLAKGLAGRPALLMVALDLLVPPTVLLLLIATAGTGAVLLLSGFAWPGALMLLAWIALLAGLGAAWAAHGRTMLPARFLGEALRYAMWKVPVILQFVTNRERRWVRTERDL